VARRLAGIVVAVIIVAAVGTLGYRMVYKTWWPQAPGRITYCGRIYETNHSLVLSRAGVTKSESRTSLPGDAPYPVVTVGRVPPVIGQPLLAARWCGVLNQWYSRLVATTTTPPRRARAGRSAAAESGGARWADLTGRVLQPHDQ
jgi:hypothetical protein